MAAKRGNTAERRKFGAKSSQSADDLTTGDSTPTSISPVSEGGQRRPAGGVSVGASKGGAGNELAAAMAKRRQAING